jgi:lipoprotein-releasing system permease protein
MPYEFFIGLRYLKSKKRVFLSLITLISIIGVMIGVMTLIVVLGVMNGFEKDIRDKILGTNAHIVIQKFGSGIKDYNGIIDKIRKVKGVIAGAPFIYSQVLITSPSNVTGVVIKGIDPDKSRLVTNIGNIIKEGSLSNLNNYDKTGIVIGKEIANRMGVVINDTVKLVSPFGAISPMGRIPRFKNFKVVGIFDSGMYEYDSSLVYINIDEAQKFLNIGDLVTGIEVKVGDIYKAKEISHKIEKFLGLPFYCRDWMELNKNLFSALKLEKLVMFVILILIIVVAAFNIISTLIMVVTEKNRDIAILKSMGAKSISIMKIFIIDGFIIGLIGTILGLIGGYGICILLQKSSFVQSLVKLPPDVYYISRLPVKIESFDIIAVTVSAVLISFLATVYPSWKASKLDPTSVLRYEG